MTAAALSHILADSVHITLIESAEIGIVGVGEATVPLIRHFLAQLGIAESEFMSATDATYKLGIEFRDFGRIGDRYLHSFGTFGRPLNGVGFHHYWLQLRRSGIMSHPISDFCIAAAMADDARFAKPGDDPDDPLCSYSYAYHFDATRFAPFLRNLAERNGVHRIEGRVMSVERHPETGDVAAVVLADGSRIGGDLFADCSGFRSLLLGETMNERWEDWSHWLPCDRAVAAPCSAASGPLNPYTTATAMPSGWRWRIPLRHRVGNGYVYSSAHIDDDAATDALLSSLETPPLATPRLLRFRAGRRRRSWVGNVVGVGLSSGFLEPLESTSIHLAQAAITRLIEYFPGPVIADVDRDGFNDSIDVEYERIRDFLILHYHATTRNDSAFWNHVRTMSIPDSLATKLTLWRSTAHVVHYAQGMFFEPSWVAVYLGQGIFPDGWDQRARLPDQTRLAKATASLREAIASHVQTMPEHAAFLARRSA
jgi:tryptophan halogenase